MILVLSPSKTLDMETRPKTTNYTVPELLDESKQLVSILRGYSQVKLSKLMDISDKLSALNVERYKHFSTPFTPDNARQALFAFQGDVYEGLDAASLNAKEVAYAQEHVRILSGLYGLLKPLDLMQAYRLEMGIGLPNKRGKDLYTFWGSRITDLLNHELAAQKKSKVLVNLASEEYFKSVRPKELKGGLVHVVFKEKHKGSLKVIGLFAKKARGMMARFVVQNKVDKPEGLKEFSEGGYAFAPKLSRDDSYIFVR